MQKKKTRLMARELATELSQKEIEQVSGGNDIVIGLTDYGYDEIRSCNA